MSDAFNFIILCGSCRQCRLVAVRGYKRISIRPTKLDNVKGCPKRRVYALMDGVSNFSVVLKRKGSVGGVSQRRGRVPCREAKDQTVVFQLIRFRKEGGSMTVGGLSVD